MDSDSISDKPEASAVTDDNVEISYRECYSPLPQPEELPSKLRQGKINTPLGKERNTLLVRTESCITSVGVSSKCMRIISSGSYVHVFELES